MKVTDREEWLEGILGNLSASDVKILIKSEEELAACQGFDRVFPTSETNKYFQFMEEVGLSMTFTIPSLCFPRSHIMTSFWTLQNIHVPKKTGAELIFTRLLIFDVSWNMYQMDHF